MRELYPHQQQGVEFIQTQKKCMLAFDMGLGKTITAIRAFKDLKDIVIVCPARLTTNWRDELVLEGETSVQIVSSKDKVLDGSKWTIISFDLLKGQNLDAEGVIVDESHYIKGKNSRSKKTGKPTRAKAVIELTKEKKYVVLLSGSPIMNRPIELWNQLEAIDHPLTHNKKTDYSVRYCRGHLKRMGRRFFWWDGGASNLDELAEKIADKVFMLKKRDVIDLPELRIHKLKITLTPDERKEYEKAWNDYIKWVLENMDEYFDEETKSRLMLEASKKGLPELMVDEFLRVSLLSKMNDARQIIQTTKLKQITSQAKRKVVTSLIEETGDQQVVVFTEYVQTLEDLNNNLKENEITYTTLNDNKLKEFQNGDYKVFTSNLIAGGTGLNMQSASTMFFIDQHWTPAINQQAISRIDRIGQVKTMDVYFLVCEDTVDEHIWEINEEKINTIQKIEHGITRTV